MTSQVIARRDILSRSMFRRAADVIGSSTIIKRLVLSAKRRIFEPTSSTMSFM